MPETNYTPRVPNEGDTVRVRNTDTGRVYAEGEVRDATRYDTDDDNAVYIKFVHKPTCGHGDDGFIEYKEGYYDGEAYSWLREAPPNTTNSREVDTDCWEFEIV